jgi:hypothetical protein
MTIALELRCGIQGFRAHPIKDRWIFSGNSRILHTASEDILTANVFGTLRNLDPKVWLISFLQNVCNFSRKEFPRLYEDGNYSKFSMLLWQDLDSPPSWLEGPTQADVFIELKSAAILIECKGFASLQKFVSTDNQHGDPRLWWDQAIRNIVRGYVYSRKHFIQKDFFFVVLSMSDKEKTFVQYLNWRRIKEQVENRMIKDPTLRDNFPKNSIDDICKKLSRQIRWVKWANLKEALENSSFNENGEFKPQSRFCEDIVEYLELKTKLWTSLMGKKG